VYVVLWCSRFLWIPSLYQCTSQYSYRVDYYAIVHRSYIFSKCASKYCISELAECLALYGLCVEIPDHFIGRTIFNCDITLLNLVRQEEVTNIQCSSPFTLFFHEQLGQISWCVSNLTVHPIVPGYCPKRKLKGHAWYFCSARKTQQVRYPCSSKWFV
jgi:hypothetical protein